MEDSGSAPGLARTVEYWAVTALDTARRAHWQAHPVVQQHLLQRRGGRTTMQEAARLIQGHGGRALGLGVGAASGELQLLAMNVASSYELCDVTPQLVAAAERAAAAAGLADRVQCRVVDVNHLALEPDSYDVITFISSLHHVERLEYVLGQCERALRPGGVFYAQEYIGPSRFAFPPDHLQLAREIWRTLDPALRCSLPELPAPDPLGVAVADPTESIRSDEIIPICRRIFPTLHVVPEEVCLTLILWYGLNHDALYDSPAGYELVRWLLEVDQALVRAGRLPSYHAEIVARKPEAPG